MCNEAMRRILLSLILIALSAPAIAQDMNEILNSSPTKAAENAFALGDVSFFMVPICFDGFPAFISNKPPESERHLWKSCEEMLGQEQYKKLQELEAWAKKYNGHLSKLLAQ